MIPSNKLAAKLRLKPEMRALLLNAPPGFRSQLGALPAAIDEQPNLQTRYQFVQIFARDTAELQRLFTLVYEALEYDGLLWIAYPKRSSGQTLDLDRDHGWEVVDQAGLRPVTQVSIDEVWSALRFRPKERVGQ